MDTAMMEDKSVYTVVFSSGSFVPMNSTHPDNNQRRIVSIFTPPFLMIHQGIHMRQFLQHAHLKPRRHSLP